MLRMLVADLPGTTLPLGSPGTIFKSLNVVDRDDCALSTRQTRAFRR